jgi:ribosomal protein S18 acetylase RimI-like enzyme
LTDFTLRPAEPGDFDFLVDMLVEAMNWNPGRTPFSRAQALADPHIAHYVTGWPRPGDSGVIAVSSGRPVGAAWLRYFTADDPGYGFVSLGIPELSLGVVPEWRGKGVGRALLRAAVADFDRVSLSVERANRAQNLYRQEGFTVVESGPDADTMLKASECASGVDRGSGPI